MRKQLFKELFPEESCAVEWQYGYMGDFESTLMRLISIADEKNLKKLKRVYPTQVRAYLLFNLTPGWWDALERWYEKRSGE